MCNYRHNHHNKYQFTAYYSSFATTEDGHKKHTRNSKKPEGHMSKEHKMDDSRMENSWTDRVRNEELLHRVKVRRNIIHIKKEECQLDWSHIDQELPSKTSY
jgi:hypothetical protein